MESGVVIRSEHTKGAEIAWFAPLCSDDYEFLGVPEKRLKSNFPHTSSILLKAEKNGFDNILCPSSYQVGQDTLAFVAAVAPMTSKMNLLAAIRCGEFYPPMLARYIASIDHILKGRLTINIISSDLPGETLGADQRYQRSREVVEILKQCWSSHHISYHGDFYKLDLDTMPVRPYQQNGGPLLYFGGYSTPAKQLCAEHCDVYLMWPEKEEQLKNHMLELSQRARAYDRKIDFGLRAHVICRETEEEARQAARRLVSRLDDGFGKEIRERALDANSLGVARQSATRAAADIHGFVEPFLWTGVGRARSGCSGALVGNPDQIVAKIKRYTDMGMRAFIFSGYPHLQECDLFARYVMPQLEKVKLNRLQGRIPKQHLKHR